MNPLGDRQDREVEPCEDAMNGDHCAHWYDDRPCCTCGDNTPDGLGRSCLPALDARFRGRRP